MSVSLGLEYLREILNCDTINATKITKTAFFDQANKAYRNVKKKKTSL